MGGPKQQKRIDNRCENRHGAQNFWVFVNAADNDEQKIGQVKIGFDVSVDDERNSENNRVRDDDRVIELRREKALFADEVQSHIGGDVQQNEAMKNRLRDKLKCGVK